MEYVFEANGLTKRFEHLVALDRIDLQIRRQSIVGLLGRNGSGKTTLLRHLMGLYLPTEGTVATLGRPSTIPCSTLRTCFPSVRKVAPPRL